MIRSIAMALLLLFSSPIVLATECQGTAMPVTAQTSSSICHPMHDQHPSLSWTFRVDCVNACDVIWNSLPSVSATADGSCSLMPENICTPVFEQYNYSSGQYGASNAFPTYVFNGCRKYGNALIDTSGSCPCAPACQGGDPSTPPGEEEPGDGEPPPSQVYGSPILVSLDDARLSLTDLAHGVDFDLDGDGRRERMAWTAAGTDDAFLWIDRDGDGAVSDGRELFGDHSPQVPSSQPNGFRSLAVFDEPQNGGDGDGWISDRDRLFSHLRLWTDENHDGLSGPSEIRTLAEAGVEALALDYSASSRRDRQGNQLRYRAPVRWAVGTGGGQAWDVFFAVEFDSNAGGL